MMKTIHRSILLILSFMSTSSFAADLGRICIAPLPIPREAQSPPWKIDSSNGLTDFYVKVNGREPIQASTSKVAWINELSPDVEHSVTILKGSTVREQFSFNLNNYVFKNRSKKDLCLFVNSLYLSWQLYKVEQTGRWCPCWSSEALN